MADEGTLQNRFMNSLVAQGSRAQKFHDQFMIGLPDCIVGSPDWGAWVELKWINFPAKVSTRLDHHVDGPQISFMKKWNNAPIPALILLGSFQGWAVVPIEGFDWLDRSQSGLLAAYFEQEKFTIGAIRARYSMMMATQPWNREEAA